jgi:hypothetical protein
MLKCLVVVGSSSRDIRATFDSDIIGIGSCPARSVILFSDYAEIMSDHLKSQWKIDFGEGNAVLAAITDDFVAVSFAGKLDSAMVQKRFV